MKKFIFSKFAGLQAYSRQLYSILSPPMHPSCIDLSPPYQTLKSLPPRMGGGGAVPNTAPPQHLWQTLLLQGEIKRSG